MQSTQSISLANMDFICNLSHTIYVCSIWDTDMMTKITTQGIYTHSMLTAQCPVPSTDHGEQRAELCYQLSQSMLLNLSLPRESAITVPSL
jgi:hypothetical protein